MGETWRGVGWREEEKDHSGTFEEDVEKINEKGLNCFIRHLSSAKSVI